ncbi:MAG: hypothetical protein MUF34_22210 [Polyangiaceae bacterium]|nr:hypothetical protein [Polyangiaceae bacterium]
MRWYVDLLSEGSTPKTTLVVEATSWQGALQGACTLRGEDISLEQITVELIADGYRALNTETRATYELRKAPEDAPLSQHGGAEPGSFADEDTFAPTSAELVEAEEAAAAESPLPYEAAEGAAGSPGAISANSSPSAALAPQGATKATEGQGAGGGEGSKAKAAEGPPKGTAGETKASSASGKAAGEVKASAISPKAVTVEMKAAGSAFKPKTGAARASEPPAKGAARASEPPKGAAGAAKASDKPSDSAKSPAAAKAGAPTKTPTGGIRAPGSASKLKSEATKGEAVQALPVPAARQPATTRAFGSEGSVGSDSKIRQGPPALPPVKPAVPLPPFNLADEPAEWAESAPEEAPQILFARGEDPSAQSPLTYREVALSFSEGTSEADAERVLRQHLQALVEQIAASPPGKYVALAAFDVRFEGRPPKPPLVTLTWKDWHGPEPKVAYPAQQQALNASMAGLTIGSVFPSPFASLPGNIPAPAARGKQPPPLPAGGAAEAVAYEVLFSRGEDPSARSPLTYREIALCFPEGTPEADAERVLRQHLQAFVEQLGGAAAGKYVALAAFDVRFEGRPPRPPLVTLTWKDWHGLERLARARAEGGLPRAAGAQRVDGGHVDGGGLPLALRVAARHDALALPCGVAGARRRLADLVLAGRRPLGAVATHLP